MHSLPENWFKHKNINDLVTATVDEILQVADLSIHKKGRFDFVTAGGRTTALCYERLKEQTVDWSKWHIYMGDERVLPVDDSERNSLTLMKSWLNHTNIPSGNLHLMPTELGIEAAQKQYEKTVEGKVFDLTLLSMGEDGHTASLFPGHSYPDHQKVVKEYDSPKPPSERISLSFEAIAQSELVIKLISGSGKKAAVQEWLSGASLPIARATGLQEKVLITEDAL